MILVLIGQTASGKTSIKDILATGEYANSLITAIELVDALDMAIEALEQNRPTAHWKDGKWCSNCGEGIPTDVWNGGVEKDEIKFCFSCGADMRGDEE